MTVLCTACPLGSDWCPKLAGVLPPPPPFPAFCRTVPEISLLRTLCACLNKFTIIYVAYSEIIFETIYRCLLGFPSILIGISAPGIAPSRPLEA
jgi:hypothetical protein